MTSPYPHRTCQFACGASPDRAVCANRFRYNAGEPPPAAGLPFEIPGNRHPHGVSSSFRPFLPPRRRRHFVNRMKLVAWIIRIVLFALLFVLALRNTADVDRKSVV